jgi:hypothetical protein
MSDWDSINKEIDAAVGGPAYGGNQDDWDWSDAYTGAPTGKVIGMGWNGFGFEPIYAPNPQVPMGNVSDSYPDVGTGSTGRTGNYGSYSGGEGTGSETQPPPEPPPAPPPPDPILAMARNQALMDMRSWGGAYQIPQMNPFTMYGGSGGGFSPFPWSNYFGSFGGK